MQEALGAQVYTYDLFGELAIKLGKMTSEQVMEVLYKKKNENLDKEFGQIAILMGLLAQEDVDEILEIQRSAKKDIGLIMVDQETISRLEYERRMNEYLKSR